MLSSAELKKKILKLLKEDEEFRYAVAGLIGLDEILKRFEKHDEELVKLRKDMVEGFKRHDEEAAELRAEIAQLRQDMLEGFKRHDEELVKLRRDMIEGFKRHDKEIAELRAEIARLRRDIVEGFKRHDKEIAQLRKDMLEGFKRHDKEIAELRAEMAQLRKDMVEGFKRHDREITELRAEMVKLRRDMLEGFRLLERHINALGTRWGLMSEEAFREGLRGVVEKELGFKVERWSCYDSEGIVYGYPSQVEVDVVVHDEKILLIEITSHAKVSDIHELRRKAVLYEKTTRRKVDKLMIVTPYADEKALEAAKELNVEVYTKV